MIPDTQEVFIVDDDPSVRTSLARLMQSAGHRARSFASAHEFLNSEFRVQPGCLLLDVRLPDVDGLELYDRLRASGCALPVIFMTGFGDIQTSVRAMKSGAFDFLPKPFSDNELLRGVEVALAKEATVRLERTETDELLRRFNTLTPREREVCRLVIAGRLNKQIARELGIAEKTVKVHRARVMTKVGVRRVAQLVQHASRIGLVPANNAAARVPAPLPLFAATVTAHV